MPHQRLRRTRRFISATGGVLDATRRTLLNALLLLLLGVLLWAAWRAFAGPPALAPKTALVVDISGAVVEQFTATSLRDSTLQRVRGSREPQTRLRDVVLALQAAAKDEQISHAVLVLDNMGAVGLPKLRELAAAVEAFKAAGKPVVAWGEGFDQRQYYLAAHASEVWLHPMGGLDAEGYGRPRSYYKALLDKVGVSVNVIRAGQYKNAAETFTASAPSPQTSEADSALYGSLWATWTAGVEKARKLPAGSVMQGIDSLPQSLEAEGGDSARWAVKRRFVDALKTRDEMRAEMVRRGAREESHLEAGGTFRQVNFAEYLARVKAPTAADGSVAVVVAQGPISDGITGPGRIGGRSTAELIRSARENKGVKALVLRVDSPGGSAFGSELIRRELELTRNAGKPVVVSMGDVAASGGYWISLAADEVWADPATITGSIGVVAMLPTGEGTLGKLGINTAGVTTTWLGAGYDPRTGLTPRYAQLVQTAVDHIYRDFTGRVATARRSTPQKIDAVAQGRVWAGAQAQQHGLVDQLGGLSQALAAAAARAKLADGTWRARYVEAPAPRWAWLLDRLDFDSSLPGLSPEMSGALLAMGAPLPVAAAAAAGSVATDLAWLAELLQQQQQHAGRPPVLAHCWCAVP